MAYKMRNPFKQKKDPYTKKDYDFLKDQKEERVHVTDYLTKDKSSGPWEKESKKLKK